MLNILVIDGVEIALTHRQVKDAVEEVGFAHAIIPHKAIYFGVKRQIELVVRFKIQ